MTLTTLLGGRTGRQKFLIYSLLLAALPLSIELTKEVVSRFALPEVSVGTELASILDVFLALLSVGAIVTSIFAVAAGLGLCARRLQDIGYPGYLVILALMFAAVFSFNSFSWVVLVVFQLLLFVVPGERAANRYGPGLLNAPASPKRRATTRAASGRIEPSLIATTEAVMHEDTIVQLEKLVQMRANGAISESEYDLIKARFLNKAARV